MEELSSSLWQAATIMLTGMVVVFAFLSALILLVKVMAKFFAPKPLDTESEPESVSTPNALNQGVSPKTVAAISSAVAQYRQRHLVKSK